MLRLLIDGDREVAAGRSDGSGDDVDFIAIERCFEALRDIGASVETLADDGETWERAGNLDEGDGYCLTNNSRDGLNRELSYPAIHQTADGTLHLSYTYHRQTIKHVQVPADWTRP